MSNPKPSVIGPRKRLIGKGNLRDLQAEYRKSKPRPFALGERRPDTLPDGTNGRESFEDNREGTKRWAKRGKLARGITWTGAKYV